MFPLRKKTLIMVWNLKRSIFGLNLDLDIDTRLPLQEIYDFKLNRKWGKREHLDTEHSREFIAYALRHLPSGSFIIFNFDVLNQYFVQLCNSDGDIFLDVPFWTTNVFYGKDQELLKLLRSEKLTRKYWKKKSPTFKSNVFFSLRQGKDKKSIQVDFGGKYDRAAQTTFLIAEKLFSISNPRIFRYDTGRLIKRESFNV